MREIAEVLKILRLDFADDLEEIEARTLCIQFCMARWEYPTWEKNVTGFGLKPIFSTRCAMCVMCMRKRTRPVTQRQKVKFTNTFQACYEA